MAHDGIAPKWMDGAQPVTNSRAALDRIDELLLVTHFPTIEIVSS